MSDWDKKMADLKATRHSGRVTCKITGESVEAKDLLIVTYRENGKREERCGLTKAEAHDLIKGIKARNFKGKASGFEIHRLDAE